MRQGAKSLLSQLKCTNFSVSYAPEYKYLVSSRITTDRNHPLHIQAVRNHREKEREGLWWVISVTTISAKKSTVRNWLKRRLREAFREELKSRGYKRNGFAITKGNDAAKEANQEKAIAQGPPVLTGSLRLNVNPTLLTAKFVDVKREAGSVVDVLIHAEEAKQGTAPNNMAQMPQRGNKPIAKTAASKAHRALSSKKSGPSPEQTKRIPLKSNKPIAKSSAQVTQRNNKTVSHTAASKLQKTVSFKKPSSKMRGGAPRYFSQESAR